MSLRTCVRAQNVAGARLVRNEDQGAPPESCPRSDDAPYGEHDGPVSAVVAVTDPSPRGSDQFWPPSSASSRGVSVRFSLALEPLA